ncbi:MAG: flagellin [Mariprofundaceae bacterium]
MALVVQTNNAAITALKHLNTNTVEMNKSLERLSSGYRINNAADDAAGYAIATKLEGQGARLKAASLNASQATAMVKMADAAINEIQNMVVRIQTLATQAASGQNSAETAKLEAERVALTAQIDQIAKGTNYNGTALLDGTLNKSFIVGDSNVAGQSTVTVQMTQSFTSSGLGLSGTGVAGFTATGAGTTAVSATANAKTYIGLAQTALDTIAAKRADFGAVQNRLSYVNANLATQIEQNAAAVSTINDADMASEMASFTKSQILVQAGTAMLAQANQASQNVLSLFR